MPKLHTHYDNLKVARNAPVEVIAAAYRSLAMKYHPDRNSGNADVTRIMAILNASYEVLSDPERRAQHDRWIEQQESPTVKEAPRTPSDTPPSPPPVPPNVSLKNFRLEATAFYWKEKPFPISEIKHLFFQRVLTTQKMNFVKVGEAHSAALIITMDDSERITLSIDESTIFLGWNRDKTQALADLGEAYRYLAQVTFQKRILRHVQQVEEKGYFEFDDCRFYPRKKIVFRDLEFGLDDSTFLRGYGYVELRKKSFGFLDKVKREVSFTKVPQFNTQTDTDVIFTLLDHYFGLRWN